MEPTGVVSAAISNSKYRDSLQFAALLAVNELANVGGHPSHRSIKPFRFGGVDAEHSREDLLDDVFQQRYIVVPGWWVDRKAKPNAIHIVNPKEIIHVCDIKINKFDDEMIKRICHQLNQKCRMEIK